MEYKDKSFEDIDKYCPASAKLSLGHIIDDLYDAIMNGGSYAGNALTEAEIESLDKMCSGSDMTDIAYVLNNIIKASKGEGTVEEIAEDVIEKVDNGICGTLQACQLGSKLKEMIEKVNGGSVEPKVEVDAPSAETQVNNINKQVKDIQMDVTVVDNKVNGYSKYASGVEGAGGDGNYLMLEFPQAQDAENTVKCSYAGGQETELSPEDYQYLIKLKQKKPIQVEISGKINTSQSLDISDVVILPKVSEVVSARAQSAATYNKYVSDLQEDDLVFSDDNKVTGTIKYVEDYECGVDTEGNYIALHIDNSKLPKGTISFGFAPSTWANVDTNDYNINVKLNKDNRQNIGLSIRVDEKILYTLDLTGLELKPKGD